jgi:hypothetical protein
MNILGLGHLVELPFATAKVVVVCPTSHKGYLMAPSQGKQQFVENQVQERNSLSSRLNPCSKLGMLGLQKRVVDNVMNAVWPQQHSFG